MSRLQTVDLHLVAYTMLIAYVASELGIGWTLARYMKTAWDFLTSAGSIPTWVTGLAFISANPGAPELVGLAATGATILKT
jgi:solute:Na+ symporter, SSS family